MMGVNFHQRKETMIHDLLPVRFDQTYRGRAVALWLFAIVLTMKLLIGANSILNGETVAVRADGIPLGSFTPAGASTILALFAIWGLAHLMIVGMGVLALVRYRAMVPLLFAVLLLEHLSRKLILTRLPMARVGAPPGITVNLVLLSLMIAGFALSMWRNRNVVREAAPGL